MKQLLLFIIYKMYIEYLVPWIVAHDYKVNMNYIMMAQMKFVSVGDVF